MEFFYKVTKCNLIHPVFLFKVLFLSMLSDNVFASLSKLGFNKFESLFVRIVHKMANLILEIHCGKFIPIYHDTDVLSSIREMNQIKP